MTQKHDVIVVGAGPAGSATAYFLAKQGADVLLLDKSEFPRDKTCGDAISPRALHVLDKMGLLEDLRSNSYSARKIHIFAPNGRVSEAPVPKVSNFPDQILVLPRLDLDLAVKEQAINAGARFVGNSKVVNFLFEDHRVCGVEFVGSTGMQRRQCNGVVIATGASSRLLKIAGMISKRPTYMLAARAYFEHVAEIDDQIEFYFDHIVLPGYGWMFPISLSAANVGVGYIGSQYTSPRAAFEKFVAQHPRLNGILGSAKQVGPIRGFPLRIDFHQSEVVGNGIIGVGEAIGLVNPFTGEGIDYALESGMMAANAIGELLENHTLWTVAALRDYSNRVNSEYRSLFVLMTFARRLFHNDYVLNRIFGSDRTALMNTIMEVSFGNEKAIKTFSPRNLWDIIGP